eukprot:GEMP01037722.1.p1 GENE.GEMP01037722.1~~GEMP01037722.1.p1  ORF type:complete len:106 (+),score=18.41 GEMP01037722.1:430-747(+)
MGNESVLMLDSQRTFWNYLGTNAAISKLSLLKPSFYTSYSRAKERLKRSGQTIAHNAKGQGLFGGGILIHDPNDVEVFRHAEKGFTDSFDVEKVKQAIDKFHGKA